MDNPTFSVFAPVHQCPNCGWPVEERAEPVEIGGLPVLIKVRTIRRLAEQVAWRRQNVTADEIMNRRGGGWRISHARHEVMWLARNLKNGDGTHRFSFPQIGRAFIVADGGMDHTSAIHGFRQHAKVIRAETMATVAADNAASARRHGASL